MCCEFVPVVGEEVGRKERKRKRKMDDLKYNDVLLSMDHKPG